MPSQFLRTLGFGLLSIASLAAAETLDGTWTGRVTAPQGPTDIALVFARTEKGLRVEVTMPVMHTYAAKFPATENADGSIAIAPLNTTLKRDGGALTGAFALGKLPIALQRGGAVPARETAPAFPPAPAPRWTHPLGSLTWAAPLVEDGVVYVGARDGKFHAVRASDGADVWTWSGPNRLDGRAVASGENIFFVDGKIELVCLARRDGALRWRAPLHDEALAGKPAPDNPTFNRRVATPLAIDGAVYAGSSDGGLYAFEAASGKKLWRFDAKAPVFSGIARDGADRLLFGCMDGSVVTLDRRDAREISRVCTGGGVVTTPVLAGGNLIVGSRDYLLYAFRANDGAPAWKFSYWFSWVESTPAVADGVIYVGASDYRRVTAFDPSSGAVRWATDVRGMAWGTPLVTADTVFIGTAAQNMPGTVIAHTGGIMALDRKTGAVKWQFLAALAAENSFGGYAGSLALAGDLVIAAGFDGDLLALPMR